MMLGHVILLALVGFVGSTAIMMRFHWFGADGGLIRFLAFYGTMIAIMAVIVLVEILCFALRELGVKFARR